MGLMKQLLRKIRAFNDAHKAAASAVYVVLGLLLTAVLIVVGAVPGRPAAHSGDPDGKPSVSRHHETRRRAAAPKAPAGPAAPVDPKAKAREITDGMGALLASPVGVGGATVADQIAPQMADPNSGYSAADEKLTDLAKRILSAPDGDEDIRRQAGDLDRLYAQWTAEVWKAANKNLSLQVQQMNHSAARGREYLRSQHGYPSSCVAYAGFKVSEDAGTTKADFDHTVAQIKRFDDLLGQCSSDMTPSQASAMPQDRS
jgi:hypothetical protein